MVPNVHLFSILPILEARAELDQFCVMEELKAIQVAFEFHTT